MTEPQIASDYDDRTTAAVKKVLVEMGQVLGSYQGKFAVVGGAVPWLLLDNPDMPHIGTFDIDLSLHAEALGDGEYALLIEALMGAGYEQRTDKRRFQLVRRVPATAEGPAIDVVVDFLMPRDADVVKNLPPLVADFAVQKADGADLALKFYQLVAIDGPMPDGGHQQGRGGGRLDPGPAGDEGLRDPRGGTSRRTPTTSTIASGTTPAARPPWRRPANRCWRSRAAPRGSDASTRSSTPSRAMARPVCASSLRKVERWATVLPTSGSRTPSVRWMPG
jgi:hypothetical protein